MTEIVYVGTLEGKSTLVDGDSDLGEMRHCVRFYRNGHEGGALGTGKIWGKGVIPAPGRVARLRLEDGQLISAFVHRMSAADGYACVVVEAPDRREWFR